MSQQAPPLPDEAVEEVQDHRVLKAVVIILGVLIIFGFIALIGGVFYQLTRDGEPPEASSPQFLSANPLDAPISLPAGASIKDMALDGNWIALHITYQPSGKSDEILVVDLTTGLVIAKLRPESDRETE